MKAAHLLLLLLTSAACAQDQRPRLDVIISPAVAEKLLVHKVDPIFKNPAMGARVTGTVEVLIDIGKRGNVTFAKIISGPRMLRQPVLDAVRKYRYRPYLLNGEPIAVETVVSVSCSNE